MSRVGKQPIQVPDGVTITVDDAFVAVKGPKGELKQFTMPGVTVNVTDKEVNVSRISDGKEHRSKHGLMRTLISNMITGVTKGFQKKLEVNGVGFRVSMAGTDLKMSLGFSHEIVHKIPEGITVTTEQNNIVVSGINKQLVGQVAADIQSYRKPEPYKGKGIKYEGQHIIRKSGKSGKE